MSGRRLRARDRAKRGWRRLLRFFGGGKLFAAVAVVLMIVLGSAFVIYATETGNNPEVHSVWSGFYWVGVTMISGSPWEVTTKIGRLIYYVLLVIKPGLFAVITAAIASELVQFVLRSNAGLGKVKVKGHIVILGWSSKGHEIIREIRGRDDKASNTEIVIVAPIDGNPSKDELTNFVKGDPTIEADLKRAGVDKASTAIVLADNSYPDIDIEDMDSRTLLSTLAVESLNKGCYTCVEIINSVNREHFERTKADELLVSGRLTGALLAHSAVTHGLSKVVGDLITFPEGNEFYWISVPPSLGGLRFDEFLATLKREHGCIAIAVSKEGADYETNPPADTIIETSDRILLISDGSPSLSA